ncbi:MAG TPA: diaminopimelate epimerase [Roseiarcus sp.]|nr:diaminopimelate epimerase [Roseiarcus sp.]
MNGAGNEIVVLDLRGAGIAASGDDARAIHRRPGLAFDQLMVVADARRPGADAYVTIFNNDGSESGACGNGARCVAYQLMRGGAGPLLHLETRAGLLECRRESESVFCVDMGPPRFGWRDIPLSEPIADMRAVALKFPAGVPATLDAASLVSMGNPHAVFFVGDAEAYDLHVVGPALETHPLFPEKANISLAQVLGRDHIRLKVWERGAGATKACGSAACATLVAAARRGLADRKARISLPGGDLTIEWRSSDDHVLMTGPVELEFEATLAPREEGATA